MAQLGPGERFGEEALVAGGVRNATVRTLTNCTLMRLDKASFHDLVLAPVLKSVILVEARAELFAGARWLDVRYPDEQARSALHDSLDLPLKVLRQRARSLDPSRRYIACCDNGIRGSVATFLVMDAGCDCIYLAGGLEAYPSSPEVALLCGPRPRSRRIASVWRPRCGRPNPASQTYRHQQEVEAAARRAEEAGYRDLQGEREHVKAERERANALVAEAEGMKRELEQSKRLAEAEALCRRHEEEERLKALEASLEARVREREQGLDALAARKEQELERARILREEAEQQARMERERLEQEAREVEARM